MNLEKLKNELGGTHIVWIGEVHGAVQNYAAHKELISYFIECGFKTVFWEMPADSSLSFADGRFSSDSRVFLKWLEMLRDEKRIELFLFDKRHTLLATCSAQEKEDILALELLDKITAKSIVITGNFHSQLRDQFVDTKKITPCAAIVKKQLAHFNFLLSAMRTMEGKYIILAGFLFLLIILLLATVMLETYTKLIISHGTRTIGLMLVKPLLLITRTHVHFSFCSIT